jgi:hypothetical protein
MIGLIGSEDEKEAVEEDLDYEIDSMYDVADSVTRDSRKRQMMSIQK